MGSGFNPWYVGGGVKRVPRSLAICSRETVSILGMLEGVLKVNGWINGPGENMFQSLVCWRGC